MITSSMVLNLSIACIVIIPVTLIKIIWVMSKFQKGLQVSIAEDVKVPVHELRISFSSKP